MSRNHIIDISEQPARLSMSDKCLTISCGKESAKKIPIGDVAVVVVSHPQVSYTQAVLSELASAGGVFITCDEKRLPNGMLVPLRANTVQTERFAAQAALGLPPRKRLWQQIVRKKIESQAIALETIQTSDFGLRALIPLVKSGDPTNVEARAARRYWSRLIDRDGFKRRVDDLDENQYLNYGYAVLRSIIARAICAAGLHPSIGLHHHNRYNAYCLADDLMEPLRPLVDYYVLETLVANDINELTSEGKNTLVAALLKRQLLGGQMRTLFDIASITTSSLAQVVSGECRTLDLPTLQFPSRAAI